MRNFGRLSIYGTLIAVCVALAAIALHPEWRRKAQDMATPKTRKVLSSVWGHFSLGEGRMKAVKSLDHRGVFVEVFIEDATSKTLKLVAIIQTNDPHDGRFNFKGHMSRIVATDVDQDGADELLIPTFDASMRPNLNVYKYQPNTKEFQKITSDF